MGRNSSRKTDRRLGLIKGGDIEMIKGLLRNTLALILVSALPLQLKAQAGPKAAAKPAEQPKPKSVDDVKINKWNSVPLHAPAYAGVKSEPAPKRDLSGIWDATGDRSNIPPPGIQPTGNFEHRAVL